MKIVNVNISETPGPTWISAFLNRIVSWILWPLAIVFVLVLFITVSIYEFIRTRIMKYKDEPPSIKTEVIFKNGELSIEKEPIRYPDAKLVEPFVFSIVDSDDEMPIFKLRTSPATHALNNCFVTGFVIDFQDQLILQRITQDNQVASSELIGVGKHTGELRTYMPVGLFGLSRFEQSTSEIVGYNKKETIRIKVDGLTRHTA